MSIYIGEKDTLLELREALEELSDQTKKNIILKAIIINKKYQSIKWI